MLQSGCPPAKDHHFRCPTDNYPKEKRIRPQPSRSPSQHDTPTHCPTKHTSPLTNYATVDALHTRSNNIYFKNFVHINMGTNTTWLSEFYISKYIFLHFLKIKKAPLVLKPTTTSQKSTKNMLLWVLVHNQV